MKVVNAMDDRAYFVKRAVSGASLFNRTHSILGRFDIELTERCNNNCVHCYINLPANDLDAKSSELDTIGWKHILKQAAEFGTLTIRFTGGEPLLRDDFTELYLYARKLGLKVIIFTNARLITAELADLFSKIPPLKEIEISVFGMQEKTYDTTVRYNGAYKEFQAGIKRLSERKIPFLLKTVLLPANRAEMLDFEARSMEILGKKVKYTNPVMLNLATRKESSGRNLLIRSIRFSPEDMVSISSRHSQDYRNSMAQFAEKFLYPQGDKLFNCGAGETGCVDAYGKCQVCMLVRHPDTVYDLSKGTLKQAYTEVFPEILNMRATNPEYLRRCARCFLKGLCGQCPGKSWSEHRTLDTPVEYLCQVAHSHAYFLGLLEEGENAWEIENWKARIDIFVNETINVKLSSTLETTIPGCKGIL